MTIPLSINNLDPDSHFYNDVRICNDECEYLNEQTFREKGEVMGITDINFSMIHLNIRSTSKHLTEFEIFNQSLGHAFDTIAFSETWLNENTFNLCNIEGYVTESKHRDRVGGGVALLVKQPLEYCVREDVSFCNEFIESLFIEVHLHNQPKKNDVVIGVIYRLPDTDINSFVAIITDILYVIKAERKTCYLLGDFNINLINVSNHIPTAEFLEVIYSHAFTPLITKPTRVTSNTATLIDNIFTNSSRNSFNGIFLSDISDHFPIFCINITKCVIRTDAEFKQQREYKTKNTGVFELSKYIHAML